MLRFVPFGRIEIIRLFEKIAHYAISFSEDLGDENTDNKDDAEDEDEVGENSVIARTFGGL